MASSAPTSSATTSAIPLAVFDGARRENEAQSLATLTRLDPGITRIVASASHATLYVYNDRAWARGAIEGPLFVAARATPPTYRLVVLNRMSTTNLVEDVDADLEIEVVDRYIIFRSKREPTRSTIRGLWFHSADEHAAIAALVERIAKAEAALSDAATTAADDDLGDASRRGKAEPVTSSNQATASSSQKRAPPLLTPSAGGLLTPSGFPVSQHTQPGVVSSRAAASSSDQRRGTSAGVTPDLVRACLLECAEDDAFVADLAKRVERKLHSEQQLRGRSSDA